MVTVELTEEELGRTVSALRIRHRKLVKGMEKFGDDFDDTLGANMIKSRIAHENLIDKFERAQANV